MITEPIHIKEEFIGKWTALYLPARNEGQADPSKYDCESKDAAWDYVLTRMCTICQEERQRVLGGISEEHDSLWPACTCEWEVLKTEDYVLCEDFSDIMEACGAEVIWRANMDGEAKVDEN